ncbi:Threonine synthase [Corynebacterium afermentans subsp. afermentans]|uniref:Threonine synthase n=1 Tax=Corynebacterium afermentans TaxID=38286 RepID=A0A9X8NAC1_9CORY|nr:threonine synthase [Corynebacterium afermentans]OAA16032.1 threonine synthase [Corynebacterium afermentans subsp. afermentans]WJY57151.1 Threonine synthase [Corynebacterium afermentans subsp. afermentans]SIP89168.1 threonine synthase [Corynebacterium afermentans]
MDYISTRDASAQPRSFTDILLTGLSPDGGLFMPAVYPSITPELLNEWRELLLHDGYAALAAEVLKLYVDDIPEADLEAIARRAYRTPVFADEEIVPVTRLNDTLHIGHLSEGPTAAFKDMAMQLLGELFEYELARRGEELNILGATSGDTGSSAEYAMRGRDGIRVFMLTPAGRMTPFQQAQMFGLDDPNIFNIALDGVFDDCQDVVKAVSADAAFKSKYSIGAVNSINFARLLAQVVYYIATYLKVTETNDERVSFCVPTGNFGNVCAGHIAKQMGLPIDRLIVATNENDVLHDFFANGEYRPRSAAETHATSSPSMDISKASNIERMLFDATLRNSDLTAELFANKVKNGGFSASDLGGPEVMERIRGEFGFASGTSTHADRVATIKRVSDEFGVLVDPHTADGVYVAEQLAGEVDTPIVVLETALPVKFADTIAEAIGEAPEVPERFADIMDAERHVTDLPNDAEAVKAFIAEAIEDTNV